MASEEQEWEDNYIREHYGKIMRADELETLIRSTLRAETESTYRRSQRLSDAR